jgi:hypothetical protein
MRYPAAIWRPKPVQPQEGPIVPRAVILHSICGGYNTTGLSGLDWLENPANPLESHFAVDGDGTVYQLRDTTQHCDANLDANAFAISIETESSIAATEPWTPAQMTALTALTAWCCTTHHIPATRITAWDGTGVGYHTMFGAPSHWTPVAKTCPGPARIAQFPALIAAVVGGPTMTSPKDWTDDDKRVVRALLDERLNGWIAGLSQGAGNSVTGADPRITELRRALNAQGSDIGNLIEEVTLLTAQVVRLVAAAGGADPAVLATEVARHLTLTAT